MLVPQCFPPTPPINYTLHNSLTLYSKCVRWPKPDGQGRDKKAGLVKLCHRGGLEAAKAPPGLLCCHYLLNDEECMKSDGHIFQMYFTSLSSQL